MAHHLRRRGGECGQVTQGLHLSAHGSPQPPADPMAALPRSRRTPSPDCTGRHPRRRGFFSLFTPHTLLAVNPTNTPDGGVSRRGEPDYCTRTSSPPSSSATVWPRPAVPF